MRKNLIFISSIVLSVVLFSMSALAQSQFGDITGTVSDQNGAVVPNATVTITGVSIGFNRTVTTDSNGFYAVRQVPAGTYNVSVGAVSGFTAQTQKNQVVALETTTTVNFTMAAGANATVDVSGGDLVAPVDTTDSKVQTSVTSAKIDLLPKGTTFTSVLRTAPGTRGEGLSGGFSIDGASGSENVFVIDGQEVTNFRTGVLNSNNNIPTQFVQEVQVKSSGFEAEFGGATGGVINVVTKGGSNDLHGEFGSMFVTSKLNGDVRPSLLRFTNSSGASFQQKIEYFTAPKAGLTQFFPTANLNGRIIKDKLWFSTSYSPQITNNNVTTDFYTNVPSDGFPAFGTAAAVAARSLVQRQTYTNSVRNENAFGRLDASPFNSLRLSATFLWNPLIQDGVIPFSTASLGGTPASTVINGQTYSGQDLYSRQGGRTSANNFTSQASWTPLSSLIISGRFSRGFLNEKNGNYFVPSATRYTCGAPTTLPGGCTGGGDPSNSVTLRDVSIRKNYEVDATYFVNAGVRQEIKGGYQNFKILNDVANGYATPGWITYYYGQTLADRGVASTPSAPICATGQTTNCILGVGDLTRIGTKGIGQNTNQSIYIQDKLTFMNRLTVNAGVRFEKEDLPSFNGFAPPINFGWGDKMAPRFGFAYALNSKGTSKIFGSYGQFYDRLKFELPRGSFGGDFYRVDFFEILPTDTFRSLTTAAILGSFNDAPGGRCPTTGFIASGARSRCQYDYRIASNNPTATLDDGKVDPDLHPFQQDEYTFGYQQELSRNYVLRARFVTKDVKWAVEDAGVRNDQGSEAYILGNPGSGLHLQLLQLRGYTKSIKPQRNYKAFDISIDRRLSNNYYFNVNYTYSRLYGNYGGLASSDEAGRTSPGVNRYFDLPIIGWTADGKPDNGLLPTDRPHVFNAYGSYILDWKGSKTNSTDFNVYQTFQSGTPMSTTVAYIVPLFLNGRGDMGRTPMLYQTDFSVSHKYKFGRDNRYTLAADVNILNLFDQKIVTGLQTSYSAVTTSPGNLINPATGLAYTETAGENAWTTGALKSQILTYLNGTSSILNRKNNSYGMANAYQSARNVRFGFRFFF
ncbi:MAG: TonB-dependent receptor [Pyrinomonadaceae bacterium]